MKKILSILLILLSISAYSQVDTIIHNGSLTSYFSFTQHNPMYVKYTLYKGGGDCNRSQYTFKTGGIRNSATKNDYVASGYDIGHMCPAEDFAYDCALESNTFYFYNALPQTPNLNRGLWKHYETEIRSLSQHDSLIVFCGGIFDNHVIPNTKVQIPVQCWKVVFDYKTKKVLYVLLFTNNMESNSVKTTMTLEGLEKLIKIKLIP